MHVACIHVHDVTIRTSKMYPTVARNQPTFCVPPPPSLSLRLTLPLYLSWYKYDDDSSPSRARLPSGESEADGDLPRIQRSRVMEGPRRRGRGPGGHPGDGVSQVPQAGRGGLFARVSEVRCGAVVLVGSGFLVGKVCDSDYCLANLQLLRVWQRLGLGC